jgi:hypothetical protein
MSYKKPISISPPALLDAMKARRTGWPRPWRATRATQRIPTDSKILDLFQEWLFAFEAVQQSLHDEEMATDHYRLREIESSLAATPANGVHGLAVKLGLHQFLSKHGDATSALSESAYLDLVRLAGRDPVAEIVARYQPDTPVPH